MTEQCKIYLDPWDKADLEGTAMLINRMPDIDEATYRGVTCQRWLVRFQPDQDNAMRWLDYADAEPYVYPIADSNHYVYTLASLIRNDASPTFDFPKIGEVSSEWWYVARNSSTLIPRSAALIHYSIIYTITQATGGSSLSTLRIRLNEGHLTAISLSSSTTVGGPYTQDYTPPAPMPLSAADYLNACIAVNQPAGESVTFENIVITLAVAWGEFA